MDTDIGNNNKPWVVLKFGGTSVSSSFTWKQIAAIIADLVPTKRVWVVISALTNVTSRLEKAIEEAIRGDAPSSPRLESFEWIRQAHYKLASQIGLVDDDLAPLNSLFDDVRKLLDGISLLKEASPRVKARVMAHGELFSTLLGVPILKLHGVNVVRVDARQLLETTPRPNEQEADRYLEAHIVPVKDPARAEAVVRGHNAVLTQGFVARTPRGDTCILGRGGSDTSASVFGALLGAEVVEIWTDVHGMFTTDPNHDPSARLIRKISYREAEELAAMGAKVLHPRCIGPCQWSGIPLVIKNTWDPHVIGTRIFHPDSEQEQQQASKPAVMAVVRRTGVTLLSLSTLEMWGASGFLARAFAHFDALGISIDLVGTSQSTVTVTLDRIPGGVEGEPFQELKARLSKLGNVQVAHPCAVVSIVGRKIRTVLHEVGHALDVFREHEVLLISESSENLNLSFVVEQDVANTLVKALHSRLLPSSGRDDLFGESWVTLQAKQANHKTTI
jgi:diaminopimelate decarboxylase/aspartate kinase